MKSGLGGLDSYTLENQHGTKKWSFQLGVFWVPAVHFQGCKNLQ